VFGKQEEAIGCDDRQYGFGHVLVEIDHHPAHRIARGDPDGQSPDARHGDVRRDPEQAIGPEEIARRDGARRTRNQR
jgi:hypothetical protein